MLPSVGPSAKVENMQPEHPYALGPRMDDDGSTLETTAHGEPNPFGPRKIGDDCSTLETAAHIGDDGSTLVTTAHSEPNLFGPRKIGDDGSTPEATAYSGPNLFGPWKIGNDGSTLMTTAHSEPNPFGPRKIVGDGSTLQTTAHSEPNPFGPWKIGDDGSTPETSTHNKSTEELKDFESYEDMVQYIYKTIPECSYIHSKELQKQLDGSSDGSTIAPHDIHAMSKNEVFANYFRQIRESGGFDFDQYPGRCMFTNIYPMLGFELDPDLVKKLKAYASMAIKKHFGHKGVEPNIKKIEKVNGGGCRNFHYYITFKVAHRDGNEETFQAEVVDTIERNIEIPICRRKVTKV